MGFRDILLEVAILDSLSDKKKGALSDGFCISYDDGYNDTCCDRLMYDNCDCGYCSDYDEDGR